MRNRKEKCLACDGLRYPRHKGLLQNYFGSIADHREDDVVPRSRLLSQVQKEGCYADLWKEHRYRNIRKNRRLNNRRKLRKEIAQLKIATIS